jgi:hypothetical protein
VGLRNQLFLTETLPTVRVVAEPRAVLHFGTPNEIDFTNYSSYGERAKAQADAVLSGLKHKFGRYVTPSASNNSSQTSNAQQHAGHAVVVIQFSNAGVFWKPLRLPPL